MASRSMPKLVVQIPCYNEEQTIESAIAAIPRSIEGVSSVEILIVDDGSRDRSVPVARAAGADHVVSHPENRGLARAFMTGIETSVRLGADIIVNTDADNQYDARDIPKLIAPILEGTAEFVIGARNTDSIHHFSIFKKILQRVGSWTVRRASHTTVPDAPSGFRAFSRSAAQRLNVFSDYTYTLETIIQAGLKGMAIRSVPIRTNAYTRPSRLVKGNISYVMRSMSTILRISVTYSPLRFFAFLGISIFLLGILVGVRFLFFLASGEGDGHIQSLILASLLMSIGFVTAITGVIADLVSVNRKLLEKIDARAARLEDRLDPIQQKDDRSS